MRYIPLLTSLLLLCVCASNNSCTKNPQPPVTPVDSLPNDTTAMPDSFTVANEWQCTIDGVTYNGAVDTGFMKMVTVSKGGDYTEDSLIVATGTSADEKTHIHFKAAMNRRDNSLSGIDASNSYMVFNLAADNLYVGNAGTPGTINYIVDTFDNNNIIITFNGVLSDEKSGSHTISGKFSCKLNSGNNYPNKFSCRIDSITRAGYFISSAVNANTLVMEGIDYTDYFFYQFRLSVRTGGTIQPGVYKSKNGDIAFFALGDPFFGSAVNIDDTLGDMTVNIESVNGNIVSGTFSGRQGFTSVQNGTFACKVAGYKAQPVSTTRWAFNTAAYLYDNIADCYAGNVLNAAKTSNGSRYYLTVNGESDNYASSFKLVISAQTPIAKGWYLLHGFGDEMIDTIYYKSGVATWDGRMVQYIADAATAGYGGEVYCYIDSIDNKQVSGTFYGNLYSNDAGNVFGTGIHKGSFNAKF